MIIAVIKAAGTKEQMEAQLSHLRYVEATIYDQPFQAQSYLREEQQRLEQANRDATQPFLPFR